MKNNITKDYAEPLTTRPEKDSWVGLVAVVAGFGLFLVGLFFMDHFYTVSHVSYKHTQSVAQTQSSQTMGNYKISATPLTGTPAGPHSPILPVLDGPTTSIPFIEDGDTLDENPEYYATPDALEALEFVERHGDVDALDALLLNLYMQGLIKEANTNDR